MVYRRKEYVDSAIEELFGFSTSEVYITNHMSERMEERRISLEEVQKTLNRAVTIKKVNIGSVCKKYSFRNGKIVVVIDVKKKTLVTAFKIRKKDRTRWKNAHQSEFSRTKNHFNKLISQRKSQKNLRNKLKDCRD